MNNWKFFLIRSVLLFFTLLVCAFGGREKPNIIQVTGLVRLVGSSSFPELIISGSESTWVIAKEERDKLHDLQYRTVTIEGEETVIEMKFANGMSAGFRRELRDIKIISVQ